MHLLQLLDNGELSLVKFSDGNVPRYAILSHTWGPDDDEVTFQDVTNRTDKSKAGYRKILFCGKQARRDSLAYFWVDSCCIDKSSSQELSVAINSMFRWYKDAERCYVYLSDVSDSTSSGEDGVCTRRWKPAFRKSRWFTRGWTLQELIAPRSVEFFSKEESYLGNKQSLEQSLHDITGIAIDALRGGSLNQFSKDELFLWAAERQTKCEEDTAYSLLGIFGVFMPLIYGEGRKNALARLEEQIEKSSRNASLSTDEEQKRMLLDSLRFDQIDARQMTIKNAHSKTCKWLLKKSEYLDWLNTNKVNEHHGFLWIRGKPGTGKSTLMKFALAHARKTMVRKVVISFFFNARGEDIEKSTIGTYRSLLLQLLERFPALQSVFNTLGLSMSSISPNYQWSIQSLQLMLERALTLLRDCSVVCFIDALDECDEQQIRDMINFFEHIGDLSVSAGIGFQIYFSSRHYPHITIQKGLGLVLEGQEGHSQDITNYLESELKIGQSKIAQQIRSNLQEKASGVFMWVVLVVGILNKEHDRGRIHTLQRRLQEIPSDLHALFRDILTRDSHNKDSLVLCIQWVLFAKQPLSPEQLYFAILSGVEPEAVSKWNPHEITQDVIKRFILDSSKGLTEVTASKLQKVQFIHESVRDFLLKEHGLGNIWPDFQSNLYGQSHEQLKQCCLTQINMDVFSPLEIPENLRQAPSQQAAGLRKDATDGFPFLEYAVHNVLYHADAAEGCGVTQAHFLGDFPLPRWSKLHNLFEKMQVRRHKPTVSLLYILAELNLANLLNICPSIHLSLEVENERYGCPLFAAVAAGSIEAAKACIRGMEADQATDNPSYRLNEQNTDYELWRHFSKRDFKYSKQRGVFSCAVELGHEGVLGYLINSGKFEVNLSDSKGRTPLWWASKTGCEAVVKLLLSIDTINLNSKDKEGKTALDVAVQNGNKAIAELLADKGADANTQHGENGNTLLEASWKGYEAVVRLLLDKGADVNAQGGQYGNALQAATFGGHEAVVRLLLDKGADVNAQGRYYINALYTASERGYEVVVKLLLDKGADVNAQGGEYGNALQAASLNGYEAVIRLLLDKGANINAQGGFYGNALHTASYRGHEAVVRLLLNRGADVNAQGGQYGNALQATSWKGYEAVVRLLLDKGADVNAQGGYYGNALQAASSRGHEVVVRLLLNKGANVNAQCGFYGNTLQVATAGGHEMMVKLLLDKGANVNAQGGHFGNALQAASERGHEVVMRLLLDKGADFNAQGGHYGTALQAASFGGHEVMVRLLLDKGADINAQGGYYGNALQAASCRGDEAVVKLLKIRGATK
jgi:ankyrin repeat protein